MARKGKDKQNIISLRNENQLYASLYVGAQVRDVNFDIFFEHEQQTYPPSISEYGNMRIPKNKSEFLQSLETGGNIFNGAPAIIDACVFDGPVLMHWDPPKSSKTYRMYCSDELGKRIINMDANISRIDVVFDIYKEISMKRETREKRSGNEGVRISVRDDIPVYHDFNRFLKTEQNKTGLFCMFDDKLTNMESRKTLVSTRHTVVKSVSNYMDGFTHTFYTDKG